MTAPELSAEEAAVVQRFEDAEPAPEALQERVARAICESDDDGPWEEWPEHVQVVYRRYANAAIAVLRGES